MDCETKLSLVVLFFFSATICMQHYCVLGAPQVPCLFIFGDSLSDSGNNNKLSTDAKVNYLPYGIDFPSGPTGRFTNGRTAVDIITQLLGFENFIPPFANIGGSDILEGVNYASGSAGILSKTGAHLGENIHLGKQLQNHKVIVSQIAKKLGSYEKAKQHLNKCLYYVNIGSNDYLNNYFLPEHYSSSRKYSPNQYAAFLVQQYTKQLKALHVLGAKKFALFGLGLLGCIPHEISTHGKNGSTLCVDEESKAALIFNAKLKAQVDNFKNELSAAKFIFIGSAAPNTQDNKLQSPEIIVGCCKVRSNGQCIPNQKPCLNRNFHIFFDAFHPTEIVNQISARSSYNAISQLVKL